MPDIILTNDDRAALKPLLREVAPGRRSFSIQTLRQHMHRKTITRMIQKRVFVTSPDDRTILVLNPEVAKSFERLPPAESTGAHE